MNDPEEALRDIAAKTGATVHSYPRPLMPVRRRVLRERHDGDDHQLEEVVLDADGTVYLIGDDRGPRVTAIFGEGITRYDWTYVIGTDSLTEIARLVGDQASEDPLDIVATFFERVGERVSYPRLYGGS